MPIFTGDRAQPLSCAKDWCGRRQNPGSASHHPLQAPSIQECKKVIKCPCGSMLAPEHISSLLNSCTTQSLLYFSWCTCATKEIVCSCIVLQSEPSISFRKPKPVPSSGDISVCQLLPGAMRATWSLVQPSVFYSPSALCQHVSYLQTPSPILMSRSRTWNTCPQVCDIKEPLGCNTPSYCCRHVELYNCISGLQGHHVDHKGDLKGTACAVSMYHETSFYEIIFMLLALCLLGCKYKHTFSLRLPGT